MSRTLEVVYDGSVFRPTTPPDLKPNTRYTISIQEELPVRAEETAWEVLHRLAGSVAGPEDGSQEHDHYLYGTPRREPQKESPEG